MTLKVKENVFLRNPEQILTKVSSVLQNYLLPADEEDIRKAFKDTLHLFQGFFPGYQKSQTPYHDIHHTLSVFLATGRLIHGACIRGEIITSDSIRIGLICALFHDTGLIKKTSENGGSGAQFTKNHEERSVDFLKNYLEKHDAPRKDIAIGMKLIRATDLAVHIKEISFPQKETALMARLLASADLIAQISDRGYAEKLRYLYSEFLEGDIKGFDSEWDLFYKTEFFYSQIARKRLDDDLDGVCDYLSYHFFQDCGEKRDFYKERMEKNILFIKEVVSEGPNNYRHRLRRQCTFSCA